MPLGHGISDPLDAEGVMSLGSLWLCGIPWAQGRDGLVGCFGMGGISFVCGLVWEEANTDDSWTVMDNILRQRRHLSN